MCLIVHRPKGRAIPLDTLERAIEDNPDGWGIVAIGKTVKTKRGLRASEFWRTYDSIAGELFIHFRLATHGPVTKANCHPFPILGGKYSVLHNGIIKIPIQDESRSDTYHFANQVLAPVLNARPDTFGSQALVRLLEEQIDGSRLAIVRDDGESMFVGSWFDEDGVSYSNPYSFGGLRFDDYRLPSKDLEDLAYLTLDEIAEVCETDPYYVAQLIKDLR